MQVEPLPPPERAALAAGDPAAVRRAVELYEAVGWTAYTRDPARLARAIAASGPVAVVREGERWLGLARSLTDGLSVCFVQDLLVHPQVRRRGLGQALLAAVTPPGVRAVLLTDGDPAQRGLYATAGFTPVDALPLTAYVRL